MRRGEKKQMLFGVNILETCYGDGKGCESNGIDIGKGMRCDEEKERVLKTKMFLYFFNIIAMWMRVYVCLSTSRLLLSRLSLFA